MTKTELLQTLFQRNDNCYIGIMINGILVVSPLQLSFQRNNNCYKLNIDLSNNQLNCCNNHFKGMIIVIKVTFNQF